ncbi:MAG: hypothetical protein H0W86_12955 [Armatimonadetes bacterium]|nr:hypothetical protein [Armatimonadota bacterium]
MKNGEALLITGLPEPSNEILRKSLFGAGQPIPAAWEPTNVMPNGLPIAGTISAKVETSSVLSPLPDGGDPKTPTVPLGATQVAELRLWREDKENPHSMDSPLLHRVRLGKRTTWRFELSLGNGVIRHMVISEDDVDPKSKIYLMADLPASVKAELETAYKAATQWRGGQPPRTRVSAVPN